MLAGGVVMTVMGLALGYSFSVVFSGEDTARFTLTFLLLFMMLGSGILINLTSLRAWLVWLEYISIVRYNMEIFLRAFVHSFDQAI